MKTGKLHGDPRCPKCKSKADGYSRQVIEAPPRTGDLVVCAYCGTVGLYEVTDKTVSIREPSVVELLHIFVEHPELREEVERAKQLAEQMRIMKQKKLN